MTEKMINEFIIIAFVLEHRTFEFTSLGAHENDSIRFEDAVKWIISFVGKDIIIWARCNGDGTSKAGCPEGMTIEQLL